MVSLSKGFRLLNRANPFVQVTMSTREEHVLAIAGEVHLGGASEQLNNLMKSLDNNMINQLTNHILTQINLIGFHAPSRNFQRKVLHSLNNFKVESESH